MSKQAKIDEKGPIGVKKFCNQIDVKVLNWEESWIENDEKGQKGSQKQTEKQLTHGGKGQNESKLLIKR